MAGKQEPGAGAAAAPAQPEPAGAAAPPPEAAPQQTESPQGETVQKPEPAESQAEAPPEGGDKPPEPKAYEGEPSELEGKVPDKQPEKKAEAEKPKPGEEAKPDGGEQKPPPEPFKFEPYTLPENVKVDDTRVQSFNEILTDPNLSPQERGQALVNMHLEEMGRAYDTTLAGWTKQFSETRAQWRQEIMEDPELGGKAYQTNLTAAARMRDLFVAPEHMAEWNWFCRMTGAAENKAMRRFMVNVARFLDEPGARPPAEKPPSDIGVRPQQDAMGKRGVMYDHPVSVAKREARGG